MQDLQNAARWVGIILIAGFMLVSLIQLFRSGSFRGLLSTSDGQFSAGRAQLLILTVFAAMHILLSVLHEPTHVPPIPSELVTALGGSQFIYLGSKAFTVFNLPGIFKEKK